MLLFYFFDLTPTVSSISGDAATPLLEGEGKDDSNDVRVIVG
jgi:hypothetical protein